MLGIHHIIILLLILVIIKTYENSFLKLGNFLPFTMLFCVREILTIKRSLLSPGLTSLLAILLPAF